MIQVNFADDPTIRAIYGVVLDRLLEFVGVFEERRLLADADRTAVANQINPEEGGVIKPLYAHPAADAFFNCSEACPLAVRTDSCARQGQCAAVGATGLVG